jgi:hypothetical protein
MKHLSLIQALILLHEQEKPKSSQSCTKQNIYSFEITNEKINLANKLAHEILSSGLPDLSSECNFLLLLIEQIVEKICVLYQLQQSDCYLGFEDIQRYTGWDRLKLKSYLKHLWGKKYIEICGTGFARVYKLSYVRQKRKVQYFLMCSDGLIIQA